MAAMPFDTATKAFPQRQLSGSGTRGGDMHAGIACRFTSQVRIRPARVCSLRCWRRGLIESAAFQGVAIPHERHAERVFVIRHAVRTHLAAHIQAERALPPLHRPDAALRHHCCAWRAVGAAHPLFPAWCRPRHRPPLSRPKTARCRWPANLSGSLRQVRVAPVTRQPEALQQRSSPAMGCTPAWPPSVLRRAMKAMVSLKCPHGLMGDGDVNRMGKAATDSRSITSAMLNPFVRPSLTCSPTFVAASEKP